MERSLPLMITATPNVCWLHPEIPYPQTSQTRPHLVKTSGRCSRRRAGALS